MAINKPHKLSSAQRDVLKNLVEGRPWDSHLFDRSAHGGATSTRMALQRLGYLKSGAITPDGREAFHNATAMSSPAMTQAAL